MEELKIEVITDLSTIPSKIESNAEELKKLLIPRLEYYNNLVVTEDGIRDAKSDKANLNKLKDAIETKRKAIKKTCLAPYEALEKDFKTLTEIIDKPVKAIDRQIKNFEEIKAQEKYAEISAYFNSIEKLNFIKLDNILNPKWKNTTMKLDTIKSEIAERVAQISADFEEIKSMYADSTLLTAITNRFVEMGGDKSQTLIYATMLERQERSRKALEEEATKQEKEALQRVAEQTQTIAIEEVEQQTEKKVGGCFAISCTVSQLKKLKQYMDINGINIIGTMTIAEYKKFKEINGGN